MTGEGDRAEDAPSAGGEEAEPVPVPEKNGSVKLKIPEDEEEKFTGLTKEELLRVAGTPGWVRTRWSLLVVFWLGWLGMLGGAVLIVLQAPRCRDLPSSSWWNAGSLYRIGDVGAFSATHDLKGVEQKVGYLSQMKVRGLVIGPIHMAPADDVMSLRFEEVSSESGTLDQFKDLVQVAHKKERQRDRQTDRQTGRQTDRQGHHGNCICLCPQSALVFWVNQGLDGVQLSGVERVAKTDETISKTKCSRVLIGVTERSAAEDVSALLNSTGVDLLISGVLLPGATEATDATERAQSVQLLYSAHSHLALLHQLLLLTLPGTPVFNYGDEIGLMDEVRTGSGRSLEEWAERRSSRRFFSALSALRAKERSLLFGDFLLLSNSSSSLAYLRVWDQSERYLAAFNWAEEAAALHLSGAAALPRWAVVVLSTDGGALPADSSVDLTELRLGPGEAALLRFPYAG
uniref:Solute carrier family 3 member 2 N-terminal domain-containing protein n=1 Tax=Cyclopterus lumpus TaxID=8103 RepID=A0A8C2ZGD9_CYCLU